MTLPRASAPSTNLLLNHSLCVRSAAGHQRGQHSTPPHVMARRSDQMLLRRGSILSAAPAPPRCPIDGAPGGGGHPAAIADQPAPPGLPVGLLLPESCRRPGSDELNQAA